MKLEDMPTPKHDALFGNCNDRSLGDELCMIYILAHSLEQRLALAVAALKELSCLGNGDQPGNSTSNRIAQETLAQIEEKT
jgi:hypothetical protein